MYAAALLILAVGAASFKAPSPVYKEISVEAPFKMEPIKEFVFPDSKFPITNYGAKPDNAKANTKAFAKAMEAKRMQRVLEIDTDVLYQWRNLVPTYKDSITRIDGIHLKNVECMRSEAVYDIKGDSRMLIKNVTLSNVRVGEVTKFVSQQKNVEDVRVDTLTYFTSF